MKNRHRTAKIGGRWPERLLLALIAALILALFVAYRPASADAASATRFCQRPSLTPHQAINCTWPKRLRPAAKRVAECESTASAPERIARRRKLGRWAADYATGTHWGVFQMGAAERKRYGRYSLGSPAVIQTRSAYKLYRDRGWQPWRASRHCSGIR